MGGWTRLWLVITVATIALQAWIYTDNVAFGRQQAQEAYKLAVSAGDNCQPPAQTENTQRPHTLSEYFNEDTNCPQVKALPSWPESLKQAALARDQAIEQAKSQSANNAVQFVLWVSGLLGALFASIGWIRQGFRRR